MEKSKDMDWQVEDKDYPEPAITDSEWVNDANDYLLGELTHEELFDMRHYLHQILWWERQMVKGSEPDRAVDYMGTVTSKCADVVGLLLLSLKRAEVTEEMLKND